MRQLHIQTLINHICYYGLYLLIGISLLVKQPFGNPPDEYNRYLIPQYIAENGTLPNGYEESIRIGGYGFSYGFQPILPYMLQGFCMRFAGLFTDSEEALLYTARAVNLLLGLLTAAVVLMLSRHLFTDRRFGWLFAYLVTFLPQSIFVHTYVNTDSCCMLSIAVMLLGLTLGLKDGFTPRSSCVMAAGIILCALSYYNAYGYILSCILLFTAFFLSRKNASGLSFDAKAFLQKGLFISAVVLIGISWWFIRSAVLYDGDFLGLQARNECAALYALPEFHPDTRVTWQNQGYSLWEMLTGSDFAALTVLSFIGIYGPMTIVTSLWIYRFYKALFATGLLLCIFLPLLKTAAKRPFLSERRGLRIFFHMNMIFCMAMPLILSLVYSYSTDYQPQGRYCLPSLLPLGFYTVCGLEKACKLNALAKLRLLSDVQKRERLTTALCILLRLIIAVSLALTVYGYAFPYYNANPIAP